MDIDVEEFDQVNYAHLRDANNLIDRIIDENGYEFGVVMDLGCGSGKVTNLVDSRLQIRGKLYALDIDMKAIKYARNNYASPRVNYIAQDIALPWEQLDPVIQGLEGKVELIFSNRVLHWIEHKEKAFENIARLLKKETGIIYANITTLWDLFHDLEDCEKEKYTKLLQIPSENEQVEQFRKLLTANKLDIVAIEPTYLNQLYPHDEFKSVILPYFPNLTKKYMLEKDAHKRNQIMAGGLFEYIQKAFLRLYVREIFFTKSGQECSEFELLYGQIRVVAKKSN